MSEPVRFLSLYRRILRLHAVKLPEVTRSVGDQYVRQEFRAHLDVKPEQREEFIKQWQDYMAHLTLEADIFGIGRDLADDDVDALSDDQKAQLAKLRESATSIGIQTRTDAGDNPYETKR